VWQAEFQGWSFGPADRQADGRILETPDFFLEQGIPMKKIVIAVALLTISASAHAGTYNYEGVTVHLQDGCMSSSCVSVYAPGYGSYNSGHPVKVRKAHRDTAHLASARKEDAAPPAAAPAAEATPAKTPEAAPADSAPAK
jgi:hypothetical protein